MNTQQNNQTLNQSKNEPIKLSLPGENEYFTQEAYKTLRTNIQFCGKKIKVIAMTSVNENEGKTTISLHVGKSFAELGKRVLVINLLGRAFMDFDAKEKYSARKLREIFGE